MPPSDHPAYSYRLESRKQCNCCATWLQGQFVPPRAEGAKAVVLFMCPRCDRTR